MYIFVNSFVILDTYVLQWSIEQSRYIYNEDFVEKQRPEKVHSKNILGIHRMH